MTAEQVWDSMLTFAVSDVDGRLLPAGSRAEPVYQRLEEVVDLSPAELREQVETQRLRITDPQKFRQVQQVARREQQQAQQAKRAELRLEARPITTALNRARRAGDLARVAELEAQLVAMGVEPTPRPRPVAVRRDQGALVRASDLPSPAPPGHFLQQFGQSDRDQIGASHTEANVPQVLSMLNGFVEDVVLGNPGAALPLSLAVAGSDGEKIRTAYLAVLGREPRGREMAVWSIDLQRAGSEAVNDLIWTLVNSHEFRFIQ
jgi:hypothetical protein